MGKFACVVFELEDGQKLEDLVNHIERFAPRLGYTAQQVKNTQISRAVTWEDKYKEIMRRLGVSPSLSGYQDLKVVIEQLHKTPNAKLQYIYTVAEKAAQRSPGTMDSTISYINGKIQSACGVKGFGIALGMNFKEDTKITTKSFVRFMHDAVFNS